MELINFKLQIVVVAILYFVVLVFVALDLWSGIRKARKRGEYRSSRGLRRTVEKISKYYNMLLVVSLIDCLLILAAWELNIQVSTHIPMLPFCTFVASIFIGFIELKSIYEKNEAKEKARIAETAEILAKLIKDNGGSKELASGLINLITQTKKDDRHQDPE